MTDKPFTRAEAEAALRLCEAAEVQAKHFDGEDHHLGCGHGSSVCPGHPDWDFARTLLPAAIKMLERVAKLLKFWHPDDCGAEKCPARRWLTDWEEK